MYSRPVHWGRNDVLVDSALAVRLLYRLEARQRLYIQQRPVIFSGSFYTYAQVPRSDLHRDATLSSGTTRRARLSGDCFLTKGVTVQHWRPSVLPTRLVRSRRVIHVRQENQKQANRPRRLDVQQEGIWYRSAPRAAAGLHAEHLPGHAHGPRARAQACCVAWRAGRGTVSSTYPT